MSFVPTGTDLAVKLLTGLLSTDSTYSCVPGDQGGLIFFTLREFFWRSFLVQIELLKFVANSSTFAK
jgi:hypothetical protein